MVATVTMMATVRLVVVTVVLDGGVGDDRGADCNGGGNDGGAGNSGGSGDEADDGVVLLQPVEADGKGADQERVEGEESQIRFKSVTVVGYVQEMSTIPPDESMNKQKLR